MGERNKVVRRPHPMQQMVIDGHGTIRFRVNHIVAWMLDHGPWDLNTLTVKGFTKDDWAQFAQLIGYSVDGWGSLPYVTRKQAEKADRRAEMLWKREHPE